MHSKKQRAVAFCAAIAIVCVTLFSFFLIADVSDHDCAAQDCRICAYIRTAENTLEQIGTGSICVWSAAGMALLFFATLRSLTAVRFSSGTLTDEKVRLNN